MRIAPMGPSEIPLRCIVSSTRRSLQIGGWTIAGPAYPVHPKSQVRRFGMGYPTNARIITPNTHQYLRTTASPMKFHFHGIENHPAPVGMPHVLYRTGCVMADDPTNSLNRGVAAGVRCRMFGMVYTVCEIVIGFAAASSV